MKALSRLNEGITAHELLHRIPHAFRRHDFMQPGNRGFPEHGRAHGAATMNESTLREYREQHFQALYDRDSGRTISALHFVNCSFLSCSFSITKNPMLRSRGRNIRFTKCTVQGSSLQAGILDDVVVDGLTTKGLFQSWGTVLRHVKLTGRIGRVMFSPTVAIHLLGKPEHAPVQQAFDRANREFYQTVDWAIDVSSGEFDELELQGIPARLVRRDPETQVIVSREKILQGAWRELDLSGTHWATSLDFLMRREDPDVVLVAGKKNKKFKRLLEGLEALRSAGIAE